MATTRRVLDGRYELDEMPIGKGGKGEVWLGRDVRLGREVAVKLIRFPDDGDEEELVRRFVRESRITARLEHPGVPAVYDVGTHERRPYLVMQRIHGISVSDLVAEHGRLTIGWAAAIAAQTCSVLASAHRASLVHRDLKPGNLMLCPDGTVRVLDFGLAVAVASGDSLITRTGQTLGTPAYMAPELVLSGEAGPGADFYALGCTLHEMLTDRAPFRGATPYAVMHKQVDERPPPLRSIRADVPVELENLVLELLAKDADARPRYADDVFERLLPFARGLEMIPGVLSSPSMPSPTRMYSTVVARVLDTSPAPAKAGDPATAPQLTRADLTRAREEAESLLRRSRYGEAAERLAPVVAPATRSFGPVDPAVLSLRMELADACFDAGDYAAAEPVFDDVARDLADEGRADEDVVRRCRRQVAACRALAGDAPGAIRRLTELVADDRARFGADDDRVLDLRRQIGLLEVARGATDTAAAQLRALLADTERIRGRDSPAGDELRALLSDIHRSRI